MSTESSAAAPPAVPAAAGLSATLLALVRREFWEHRALWLAPLVTAGLLALTAFFAHVNFDIADDAAQFAHMLRPEAKLGLFSLLQWGLALPLYVVMLLVLSFYLLDCLYAERKDRSILFWKSLPVSDGLTVLSKLLTALVAVPLGVFVLAIATHFAFTVIWEARVALGSAPAFTTWDTLSWIRLELAMLLMLGIAVLWYAPLAAYLLLVSAWARRSPFVFATLPPVLAPLLERIAFNTHYLGNFVNYRTFGIWGTLFPHHDAPQRLHPHSLGEVLDQLHFGAAYTDLDLWLGVLAAAGLLFAATRIRRYRDDT